MGRFTKREKIDRHRRRKAKIRKLKARIAKAKDNKQIQVYLAKIHKINPFYRLQNQTPPAK